MTTSILLRSAHLQVLNYSTMYGRKLQGFFSRNQKFLVWLPGLDFAARLLYNRIRQAHPDIKPAIWPAA